MKFENKMRRSTAPSHRRNNFASPCSSKEREQPISRPNDEASSFPEAVRSTASIINILNETNKVDASFLHKKQDKDEENLMSTIRSHDENYSPPEMPAKRIFTVVWGKQSKKKHKTWEGDGTLEVGEKNAVLKDIDGNIMGRASGLKTSLLQEGSRLNVGSKEVEIIELKTADDSTSMLMNKRQINSTDDETALAKRSRNSVLPQRLLFKPRTCKDYKPLVMPSPSHEHQWKYNTLHLPVTEVSMDPCLAGVLRPHQRLGIIFLYECIMGMRKPDHYGAILADEMGLGKTLQCISLIWMLLKKGPYGGRPILRRILIVSPSSLVSNWQKEFCRWLGNERIHTFVVNQKNKPKDYINFPQIPVMLISYEMLVRCFEDIYKISFDLLICDEGHRLKNMTIKTTLRLSELVCNRRILLTGTPIQNYLHEFYALVNFVNPGVLGSSTEFHKHFEEPVIASQQPSAGDEVRKLGEKRASELNHLSGAFILRRTQDIIDDYLPMKHESVIFCTTTKLQQAMYEAVIDYWEHRGSHVGHDNVAHLAIITALKKICSHPYLVNLGSTSTLENEKDDVGIVQYLSQKFPLKDRSSHYSGKMSVAICLLQKLSLTKEKIVLVSYFTQTLDLLASLCEDMKYKFCRLDGSTSIGQRAKIVEQFNRPHSDYFVFLLSARAGGLGLNLFGASRLVLYDSDWNPATDLQAMSRIWRDGQKRSVYIYRLLTTGSIEEKIFQRQISKTGLSGAIVDPNVTTKILLSKDELKNILTFDKASLSLTHDTLKCPCLETEMDLEDIKYSANRKILNEQHVNSLQRDCQLQISVQPSSSSCVRMNQLYQWEHYAQPVDFHILQELSLSEASDYITFIFKNSSQSKEEVRPKKIESPHNK